MKQPHKARIPSTTASPPDAGHPNDVNVEACDRRGTLNLKEDDGGADMTSTANHKKTTARMLTLAMAALVALGASACTVVEGNGTIVEETRPVSDFIEIEASDDFIVDVRVDPAMKGPFEVRVTGDENLVQYVETQQIGRRLVLSQRPGFWLQPSQDIRIDLRVPSLSTLEARGGVLIAARGFRQRRLRVLAADHSRVRLEGEVDALNVVATGSAQVEAQHLITWLTRVDAAQNAHAQVCVEENLDAIASGDATIAYSCSPFSVYEEVHDHALVVRARY